MVRARDLVDEAGNDTALYFWPALGSLDEAWICSLHTKDEVIDLTQLYQPLGTFKTSRSGVDVQFGNQYIRGTFPEYDIYVEGTHNGEEVSLEVHMSAETRRSRHCRTCAVSPGTTFPVSQCRERSPAGGPRPV